MQQATIAADTLFVASACNPQVKGSTSRRCWALLAISLLLLHLLLEQPHSSTCRSSSNSRALQRRLQRQ